MASTKTWAAVISYISFHAYFALIILQVPLYRIPCRSGICKTPLEFTSSQLIATEACPAVVVKALLYPGAIADAFMKGKAIPSFHHYPNFNKLKHFDETVNLQRIEILVGSYLSVAGALLGCFRPGRMSLLGTLLILWGLSKELFLGSHEKIRYSKDTNISIYPTMLIASLLAFLSIKGDVRKLIQCFKFRRHKKSK